MINTIVPVSCATGEYPIYIGSNIISDPQLLAKHIIAKQVMIITNHQIAPLYLNKVQKALSDFECDHYILPDGEQYKTLEYWNQILNNLAEKKHHRDTTLIALGGGVVGDMTGFAAACYQRGVAFIQIPTTLLAQVDASIGGKTAINHPMAKNLVGAFHQPQAVIIDIDTLTTLPPREYRAGIAEIIKAALIKDANFFGWLEKNISLLLEHNPAAITEAITRACIIKRDIVARDEKEQGERALLNLGHTFGHAVEHALGYGQWLHGEAVAWGMLRAAELAYLRGHFSDTELQRLSKLISDAGLDKTLTSISSQQLIEAMQSDKKILNNTLRFIIPKGLGQAIIINDVSREELVEILAKQNVC